MNIDKNPIKIGDRFTRLKIIDFTNKKIGTSKVWKCKCDCGKICYLSANALKRKNTKSCGCLRIDLSHTSGKKAKGFKHGKSGTYKYKLFQRLLHNFNISLKEYYRLHIIQKGNCAICGVNEKILKKHLGVDHNHKTGKVRGLLCNRCNVLLGFATDSKNIFKKAIKYLKRG